MAEIGDWREKIDEIDLKLVKLLNQRSRCAIEIGRIKEEQNLQIYDPKREKQVIRNVQRAGKGPLTKDAMKRLFERIIDESRRAEREARQAKAGAAPVPRQRAAGSSKRKARKK